MNDNNIAENGDRRLAHAMLIVALISLWIVGHYM